MIKSVQEPLVFCDVETTGTLSYKGRITEIAAIRYEQGVEVDRLVTLVNPGFPIDPYISLMTGIRDDMLTEAPYFEDIAPEVSRIFAGATLVAHNAPFDYGFIRMEMERAGYEFHPQHICTAKLSRRLFPEYLRHNLSVIIGRYGFVCKARHRALGDTEVLVQFAQYIDEHIAPETLEAALHPQKELIHLPPNILQEDVDTLPHAPGVYSFYGKEGELLYVGKSIDIKKRVQSHFTNSVRDNKALRIWEELHTIRHTVTASDLGASLLELYRIKTEEPLFNRMSRRTRTLWCLEKKVDAKGYMHLSLIPTDGLVAGDTEKIYGIFRSKADAKTYLESLCREQGFCPILMGLEKGPGPCFSHKLGICKGACAGAVSPTIYNLQLELALAKRRIKTWLYDGPKTISKINQKLQKKEEFVIDNWVLQRATLWNGEEEQPLFPTHDLFFDYDMYKVLIQHIY